jgi:hypothetical protein
VALRVALRGPVRAARRPPLTLRLKNNRSATVKFLRRAKPREVAAKAFTAARKKTKLLASPR